MPIPEQQQKGKLNMKNQKILGMTQLGILIAIIIVMAFTGLGYIRTGGLEISLITVPVAIGAMVMGPGAGAVLGLAFGITSFLQCFGFSPFGAQLLAINPFLTFLVCVPTRTAVGWLAGLIFKGIARIDKTKTAGYFVTGFCTALLNTLLFMGVLLLCFWNTDYIQSLNVQGVNVFAFAVTFVGLNGALEMPACCVLGGAIGKALSKAKINRVEQI